MNIVRRHRWHRGRWLALAGALWLALGAAVQAQGGAADLQQRRTALQPRLQASPFGQPLVLDSREGDGSLAGEVHAEMPQPFARLAGLLRSAPAMCEMLLLHLNVRGCRAGGAAGAAGPGPIVLLVGPKQLDSTSLLQRIGYGTQLEAPTADFVRLTLAAAKGPLGTRDYRIVIEATPIDSGRSFVRLSYAYAYGFMGQAAMQAYLSTAGRAKIGFTVEAGADGKPQPVRGARGALERNVMRYYLALLAYGLVDGAPGGEHTEARLRQWFALTERHAAQLHELDLDDYLREKRADLIRIVPASP